MKVKLSKSQWEAVGKKAGWMKQSQFVPNQNSASNEVCKKCHGDTVIHEKIKNLGTGEMVDHTSVCDYCRGKGYTTEEDRKKSNESYMHSMGVGPCPYGNDCNCK